MNEKIVGRVHNVGVRRKGFHVYFESRKDSLTGLMKYDNFIRKVNKFIANNRDENIGLAIVYSDFRHFKAINDKYGATVANGLLETFAHAVDSASPMTIAACRVYFDNIVSAVAYDNSRTPEEFSRIITDYNHLQEAEIQRLYLDQHITINTGIYVSNTTKGINAEMAISNANLARKQAKATRSKEALLFTPEMINTLVKQMELSSNLPHAIADEELKVYFQPKVECGSEKVIGAEALVRWIKPDGTFIYPDQFIPLFESNGLIVEVDYYVYRKVFQYIRKRLDENLPIVPISMNVSRIHLISDGIIDYIKSLFEEYKIPPELVEFELTENIYIKNMNTVIPLINELRVMGVKISMDDFGSGHSSLNELNSLPIDVLKLDRVFMTEILNDKQQIILSCIIDMAKRLNIVVLCEGVENVEQNEFLRKIGCDMVQGYYYSKPLNENDFADYIQHRTIETTKYTHFAFDNNLMDDSEKMEGSVVGGGITYCNGPAGMSAIHFSGGEAGNNLIELPTGVYPVSNYTITMWFKEDEEQLWSSLMYTSFESGFSNIIPHGLDLKASFRIKNMTNDNSEPKDAHGVLLPRRGAWNFIAVSYNYRTNLSCLYLNGLPAGKCESVPILGSPMRVLLGGDIYRNSFKGCIADLRIYNQELSPIEILYTFNEFNR